MNYEPTHVIIGVSRCGCIVAHEKETRQPLSGKVDEKTKAYKNALKARGLTVKRQALSTFEKQVIGCKLCLRVSECSQHPAPLFAEVDA